MAELKTTNKENPEVIAFQLEEYADNFFKAFQKEWLSKKGNYEPNVSGELAIVLRKVSRNILNDSGNGYDWKNDLDKSIYHEVTGDTISISDILTDEIYSEDTKMAVSQFLSFASKHGVDLTLP